MTAALELLEYLSEVDRVSAAHLFHKIPEAKGSVSDGTDYPTRTTAPFKCVAPGNPTGSAQRSITH